MEDKDGVKITPAGPTWWFEGDDKKPFPAEEKEAFEIMTNRSTWKRRDLKLIGYSDGSTFNEIVKSAGPRSRELNEKIAELKKTLGKYVAGHDKLLFEEFAEKDDPRVLRAQKLIDELEAEIQPLEEELQSLRGGLVKKAYEAELEKARGVIQKPRDFSVVKQAAANAQQQQALDNFANAKRVI